MKRYPKGGVVQGVKDKEAQEKKHKETCAKKRALRKDKNKKNKVVRNQFAVYPKK